MVEICKIFLSRLRRSIIWVLLLLCATIQALQHVNCSTGDGDMTILMRSDGFGRFVKSPSRVLGHNCARQCPPPLSFPSRGFATAIKREFNWLRSAWCPRGRPRCLGRPSTALGSWVAGGPPNGEIVSGGVRGIMDSAAADSDIVPISTDVRTNLEASCRIFY